MDFVSPPRSVELSLVAGRGHYDAVIDAVRNARRSLWIATANLKELLVEDHNLVPGRRRGRNRYRSILEDLDALSKAGVEIRILHAALPSRAFRERFDSLPHLVEGGIELRQCPRVHLKAIIVDARLMYLGSANWTGAGIGAKSDKRRNFELGILTDDDGLLDEVQALYDALWRGEPCASCDRQRDCEIPLANLA